MNRNLIFGLAGLAAVVLVGLFVVMPLLSGGEDEEPFDAAAIAAAGANPSSAEADDDTDAGADTDEEAAPQPVAETFEVFTARDPFQQLVVESGPAVTPVSQDVDGDTTVDPVDDDDDSEPSSGTAVDGTVVQLVEVFEDTDGTETVQVTVNGSGYDVTEGDDFAGRFRTLDITDDCATFLYGDQRFTLCEGESIRK